jgi:hypothetical protein
MLDDVEDTFIVFPQFLRECGRPPLEILLQEFDAFLKAADLTECENELAERVAACRFAFVEFWRIAEMHKSQPCVGWMRRWIDCETLLFSAAELLRKGVLHVSASTKN